MLPLVPFREYLPFLFIHLSALWKCSLVREYLCYLHLIGLCIIVWTQNDWASSQSWWGFGGSSSGSKSDFEPRSPEFNPTWSCAFSSLLFSFLSLSISAVSLNRSLVELQYYGFSTFQPKWRLRLCCFRQSKLNMHITRKNPKADILPTCEVKSRDSTRQGQDGAKDQKLRKRNHSNEKFWRQNSKKRKKDD